MASLNEVRLIGNLGKDPESRDANATSIVRISVATQRKSKEAETDWHDVTLFGQSADFAKQYLRKGDCVLIAGHIRTSSWQDKESGKTRYSVEIVADQIQLLVSKSKQSADIS